MSKQGLIPIYSRLTAHTKSKQRHLSEGDPPLIQIIEGIQSDSYGKEILDVGLDFEGFDDMGENNR